MLLSKFNAKGKGTLKYTLSYLVVLIIASLIYIIEAVIPYGKNFLFLLQGMLNGSEWDLIKLLTPIFWIIVYYFAVEVVMIITTIILISIAKNKY